MILNSMKFGIARLIQSILLMVYRVAVVSGILSTGWGRATFEWAYMVYKSRFEATTVDGLRKVVSSGADAGLHLWLMAANRKGASPLDTEPGDVCRGCAPKNNSNAYSSLGLMAVCHSHQDEAPRCGGTRFRTAGRVLEGLWVRNESAPRII